MSIIAHFIYFLLNKIVKNSILPILTYFRKIVSNMDLKIKKCFNKFEFLEFILLDNITYQYKFM